METRPPAAAPPVPAGFRLAAGGVLAAAVAVSAQLQLPLLAVPITMQTAVTGLAGLILPPGEAFWAMAVYLGLGAAGVPVFAGFEGGLGVLFGPKGGFLLAFPFQAALTSWLLRRGDGLGLARLVLCLLAGIGVVYLLGWAGLLVLGGFPPWGAARALVPFLPVAMVKVALAALAYRAMAPRLPPPYRRLPRG